MGAETRVAQHPSGPPGPLATTTVHVGVSNERARAPVDGRLEERGRGYRPPRGYDRFRRAIA